MNAEHPDAVVPDETLDEVLAAYLKAVEAGQSPDRAALLARHPDAADALAEFFAGFDQFEQVAAPLRAVRPSTADAARVNRSPAAGGVETVNDPNQTAPVHTPAPTLPRTSPPNRPTGGEIPGYEILGVLGRGGMGIVYKACQLNLKRLVALKMIRAGDQADEAELTRFRVEAEAVARVHHPNIVQIYEVGEHCGQPFCSLEFVSGGTLGERLKGTPQPPRQAAELTRTLAMAMEAAHQRGIVHRDLKPANVLLTGENSPKITDFGLAKRLDDDVGQTTTGAVMGTPAYMAPEQAAGQKEVGPAADVYALGAILYEMLTGRPPFRGASVLETLEQVRTREPVSVRLLQPKVSRDLETICLKCLSKEPHKRYATAETLAQDLERWLKGEPIKARRSRVWERTYRWARRNPVAATLGVLLVVAFVGGFAGVAWQLRQTQAALIEAKTNLYFQHVNRADREAQAGNTDAADVLLDLCPAALRHWEWHYLKRRCHGNWLRLAGHTDLVRYLAYSADGKRLASCGNDRTVRVWETSTGKELLALRHTGWVRTVVFDTDGRRLLAAGEDGSVKVWDTGDGRELHSLSIGYALVATFSPDGRLVATLVHGKGLTIHDLETGQVTLTIPGEVGDKQYVGFSPDGLRLVSNVDARLRIWDIRSGQQIHLLHQFLPRVYTLVFSPDGSRLFASYQEEGYATLKVWDTATGQVIPESLSTPLAILAIAVSSDGQRIATGGHEGTVKIRDTAAGKDQHRLRTFNDPIAFLAFRPDSQGLAVAAGGDVWLRAWVGQKDHGPITIQGHTGGTASVAFNAAGSRLASCGENDQVKVWNAGTGQAVLTLTAPARGYTGVAFSPDGERLLATGRDGTLYTWDVTAGQPSLPLPVQKTELAEGAFSPDGRRIATAGRDRTVRIWDTATGVEVLTCTGHDSEVWGVRFSPDGTRIASAGSDGTVRLWDARTSREILTLRGHVSHVQSVSFRQDGRMLASASTDETVRLWDVVAGREAAKLEGHTGPVRGLSFTPDGRRLASASEDGTVRLWDVATGQEALSLADPSNGRVRWVAFSPDGWRLATAGSDGTVKIWDATPVPN